MEVVDRFLTTSTIWVVLIQKDPDLAQEKRRVEFKFRSVNSFDLSHQKRDVVTEHFERDV